MEIKNSLIARKSEGKGLSMDLHVAWERKYQHWIANMLKKRENAACSIGVLFRDPFVLLSDSVDHGRPRDDLCHRPNQPAELN